MFVADISNTHLSLLNKFNVIEHHLLIVTNTFKHQETLLTVRDFQAIWRCMTEFEGLAFYNGGEIAGASQDHKHLQLIPLPMASTGREVPMESLFEQPPKTPGMVPGIPFVHAFKRFSSIVDIPHGMAAQALYQMYRLMLQQVGMNPFTERKRLSSQALTICFLPAVGCCWSPDQRNFLNPYPSMHLGLPGPCWRATLKKWRSLKKKGVWVCCAILPS